jgi:hypothetical protein
MKAASEYVVLLAPQERVRRYTLRIDIPFRRGFAEATDSNKSIRGQSMADNEDGTTIGRHHSLRKGVVEQTNLSRYCRR